MTVSQELIAGRYRLSRSLGSGGMGRVWLARDEVLRRDVAMKEVLLPEHLTGPEREELKARTLREARAAARLSHPNVVQIYDVVRGQDPPWIVMEYVSAVSLHQLIKERGPVSPQRAAQIGLAMLGALRAAHRNGVLHRDVKPSNVLIAEDGRVVLTDFGLATIEGTEGAVTRPGLVLGSPQYVAPERARDGVSTPETDLWSLGATLYAAVEGRSPYARSSAMATLTALATRPPDPSTKAGPLKGVLQGLLRKNPRARLTADAVEPMLRRVAGGDQRARLLLPRPRSARDSRPDEPSGGASAPTSPAPTSPAPPPIPEFPPLAGREPTSGAGAGNGSSSVGSPRRLTGPAFLPGPAGLTGGRPSSIDESTPRIVAPSPVPVSPGYLDDEFDTPRLGGGGTRPWWRILLVLGALLLVPAVLVAMIAAGAFDSPAEPDPGGSGSASASGPTTPSADTATASRFAPPPTAVTNNEPVPPRGFVIYTDPAGYRIPVPDGWRYSIEDGWTFFRERGGRRVLCVDVLESALPADPPAAMAQRERERRASGELPNYRRIGLTPSQLGQGSMAWEYTYTGTDGTSMHDLELLYLAQGRGYRIRWTTAEFDWGPSKDLYWVITGYFKPAR